MKVSAYILYSGVYCAFAYYIVKKANWFSIVYFLGLSSYLFYLIFKTLAKLQHVEFDDAFLYVLKRKMDYVIPLENIESVEIVSLGGVYKVNLFRAEQLGKEFYFKPSLLYPLNYKTKDLLVNHLRRNIAIARQKNTALPNTALMS